MMNDLKALVKKWRDEADSYSGTMTNEDRGYSNAQYQLADELEAALSRPAGGRCSEVIRALERFDETTSDCGETDLPRPVLDGLVAFGYLTKRRAGRYGFKFTMTEDGDNVLRQLAVPTPHGGEDARDAERYRDLRELIVAERRDCFPPVPDEKTEETYDAWVDAAIAASREVGDG